MLHVFKLFLAIMICGFPLWSSMNDEDEKISLYYPDSVAEFTQAFDCLLQNHIGCGEEAKSFLLLLDFHGVISNQADPDAELVEPIGSRGGMVDWLKTLRQHHPELPIKVASAWTRSQDIIKNIKALGLETIIFSQHKKIFKDQKSSRNGYIQGDLCGVRPEIRGPYTAKGYVPQYLHEKGSIIFDTIVFVDDSQKNTGNFCQQIKITPIYHNLKRIHVFNLSGDPLMDGQDLSKPLPARGGFN